MTKVFAAIDINNLWHSCRHIHGEASRVKYAQLIQDIRLDRDLRAMAYAVSVPSNDSPGEIKNQPFINAMQRFGYEVKTRTILFKEGMYKPFFSDWIVGITMDAIEYVDQYDTFALVSGDGDFVQLTDKLQSLGKQVEVYTFQTATTEILYSSVDKLKFLGDNILFQEKASLKGHGK